jgi:hypothetical protein
MIRIFFCIDQNPVTEVSLDINNFPGIFHSIG